MTDQVVRVTFDGEMRRTLDSANCRSDLWLNVDWDTYKDIRDGLPIICTVNGEEFRGVVWSVSHTPMGVSKDGALTMSLQVRIGRDLYDHARKLQQDTPHD